MTPQDIHFSSAGQRCAGWFYAATPALSRSKRPCVVMAHGLGGIKEMRLAAFAERFAAAGYHVVVFDYRHFGASEGMPRQLLDIASQHEDWRNGIAYARSLPQVDPGRIVLWGSSLSGGHVIEIASRDKQVAALISQVPHFDGLASLAAIGPRNAARLTMHGMLDLLRASLGMTPHYVPSAAQSGQLGLITKDGEYDGYAAIAPVGMDIDWRVAARFAMAAPLYSPGRKLAGLEIPSLIQVALNDCTTPPASVIRACRKSANANLKQYDTGHFQPYVEPMFSVFIADQLAFLHEQFG